MYISIIAVIISLWSIFLPASTIKIGASPALSTAGIYIAKEKGYFDEQGLKTEIIVLDNSTSQMTMLLSKNELQVGAGNIVAGLFNSFASGDKIKIVADKGHISDKHQYLWLVIRKDLFELKKIREIKDLKGMRVALPSTEGSSQQIALDSMLKAADLKLTDIKLVKLGYPETLLAFRQKELDAAVTLEPYVQRGVEENLIVKFKSVQDFRPFQQSAVLVFSEAFFKSKEARPFLKAYLRGVKDYNEALTEKKLWLEIAGIINKYSKIDPEKSWKNVESIGLSNTGELNYNSIVKDYEWYKQYGYIKKDVDLQLLVDQSLLDLRVLNKK